MIPPFPLFFMFKNLLVFVLNLFGQIWRNVPYSTDTGTLLILQYFREEERDLACTKMVYEIHMYF